MSNDDDDWDDDFDEIIAAQNLGQPQKPIVNWSCLQVHPDQSQNPILNHLSETPYQLNADIGVDFAPSADVGILFISLKYHNYRPKYVEDKIASVPRSKYRVLVLLLSVDSEGPDLASRYLSILCTKLDITFMVGFGQSECAQYITNFKRLEHKSVDWLRPKTDETNRLARVLGCARGVNSTDADTLIRHFGTLGAIATAKKEEIKNFHGIGNTKADRLIELFNTPFKN